MASLNSRVAARGCPRSSLTRRFLPQCACARILSACCVTRCGLVGEWQHRRRLASPNPRCGRLRLGGVRGGGLDVVVQWVSHGRATVFSTDIVVRLDGTNMTDVRLSGLGRDGLGPVVAAVATVPQRLYVSVARVPPLPWQEGWG
jgi:hypothetical protein